MHRVVHQRGERLAVRADRLHDVTARIVKPVSVVVVGDLPLRISRSDAQARGLQLRQRFVDRFRHARADRIEIFQIRRRAAFAIRKPIRIRRAVGVGGTDENVLRRNALHQRANSVPERGGESEEVRAHDRDLRRIIREHEGADVQLARLLLCRLGRPHPTGHREERIRRDNSNSNACAKLGKGRVRDAEDGKETEKQRMVHKFKRSERRTELERHWSLSIQNVGPNCQGANSSSPRPASSLFVFSPLATAMIFSKIRRPTCSTVSVPSRIVPALMSMSSSIHW